MAMTAAKLIWKLGPTSDSGHNTSTTPAATAIIRSPRTSRNSLVDWATDTAATATSTTATTTS